MFQHITRTGTLTGLQPRIYVSCHKDDLELYLKSVCADIFAAQENCAVFYDDEPGRSLAEGELEDFLSDMRLVVIPVTRKLLRERSRALDTEIPAALRLNIPVLPIMFEEDETGELIGEFNSTEVFGGLQFLNKYDRDPTALRYQDKLATFLAMVLLSESDTERIHEEFSSKVFLSYRKKDRAFAQELMRRIHSVDVCRDTAIWYDEYLIPGESFDENIMAALNDSDVFIMSVSPAFEEPGNYVADHEYPDAVRKNKPLVAAEMKRFDQKSLDNLETLYPGINALMVDPDDADSFGVTLRQRLIEDAGIDEEDLLNDDGEHLYYIALAYQNGIRTEPDPAKAANIFRMSAENGCCEAWIKLITMYHLGSGVAWDPNEALSYCEKAEAAMKPFEGSSLRNDNALADVYDEKVRIYSRLRNEEETINACWQAVELRKKMQAMYEDASLGERFSRQFNYPEEPMGHETYYIACRTDNEEIDWNNLSTFNGKKIGVEKALEISEEADLVLYVIDSSVPLDENDHRIINIIKDKNTIILFNKSDLEQAVSESDLQSLIYGNEKGLNEDINNFINNNHNIPILRISLKDGNGIDELEKILDSKFVSEGNQLNDEVIVTNLRHFQELKSAKESLLNVEKSIDDGMEEDFFTVDLMDAYRHLGMIIGEETGEDLVNEIFSKFCMGK